MFQIYQHGYLSLGTWYYSPRPPAAGHVVSLHTGAIVAPFWLESGAGPSQGGDSVVYYRTYTRWSTQSAVDQNTSSIMDSVSSVIAEEKGDSSFQATHVTIVTWKDLRPMPYNSGGDEVCSRLGFSFFFNSNSFIHASVTFNTILKYVCFEWMQRTPAKGFAKSRFYMFYAAQAGINPSLYCFGL